LPGSPHSPQPGRPETGEFQELASLYRKQVNYSIKNGKKINKFEFLSIFPLYSRDRGYFFVVCTYWQHVFSANIDPDPYYSNSQFHHANAMAEFELGLISEARMREYGELCLGRHTHRSDLQWLHMAQHRQLRATLAARKGGYCWTDA